MLASLAPNPHSSFSPSQYSAYDNFSPPPSLLSSLALQRGLARELNFPFPLFDPSTIRLSPGIQLPVRRRTDLPFAFSFCHCRRVSLDRQRAPDFRYTGPSGLVCGVFSAAKFFVQLRSYFHLSDPKLPPFEVQLLCKIGQSVFSLDQRVLCVKFRFG